MSEEQLPEKQPNPGQAQPDTTPDPVYRCSGRGCGEDCGEESFHPAESIFWFPGEQTRLTPGWYCGACLESSGAAPGQSWVNLAAHLALDGTRPTPEIQERLRNANRYFRWKAAEVFNDKPALSLLRLLNEKTVIDINGMGPEFDKLALAKLTAANFCEIGAKVIFITHAGQRFIRNQ